VINIFTQIFEDMKTKSRY